MRLKEYLKQCKCTADDYFDLFNFNQFRTNEDQLATILAHELSHAILGHSVRRKVLYLFIKMIENYFRVREFRIYK